MGCRTHGDSVRFYFTTMGASRGRWRAGKDVISEAKITPRVGSQDDNAGWCAVPKGIRCVFSGRWALRAASLRFSKCAKRARLLFIPQLGGALFHQAVYVAAQFVGVAALQAIE